MRFLYKAKNNQGEMVTGTVKAATEFDAERILVRHALAPIDIIPENKKLFSFKFGRKSKTKDREIFARQLATMISAGLPLTKAISITTSQARTEYLRGIYHNIYKDLEEGSSFSRSLAKYPQVFDRVFVSVVNSGEVTGKLDVVLAQMADQLERDNNISGKIRGALYYPAFILVAMVCIGAYMMVAVVPQLKTLFDQASATLPWSTRTLIALSDFMVRFWWLVIILVVGLFGLLKFWFNSEAGVRSYSYFQIKTPGIKPLAEGVYISRFARVMQMLISSGVPLLDSIRTSASIIKNELFEEDLMGMVVQVEKGVPLSTQLLKSSVFPQFVGQMVAVGEETGQMDKVLSKVADYYEEDASERIKTISTLIEPVILVIIGLGVAFLVFAILMPIYNLAQIQ